MTSQLGCKAPRYCRGKLAAWRTALSSAIVGSMLLTTSMFASAQSIREESSLRIVPDDVSFYASSLNHREMYDAVAESRAFAEFMQTPVMQMTIETFRRQLEAEGGVTQEEMMEQISDLVGEEQLEDLIAFGIDVVSHEAFIYGDDGFTDLLELMAEIGESAPSELATADQLSEEEMTELMLEFAEKFADENLDRIRIPDTVIGFRVEDPERAMRHVELLHAMASLAMVSGEVPREIRRAYGRKKVGDTEFIRFRMNGGMLPLEDIDVDWDDLTDDQTRLVETYLAHVEEMTFSIGVGVIQDFLLISIGDSLEHLEDFGQGDLLVDRKEFAPVREHGDEQFVGMYYVSDRFMKGASQGSAEDWMTNFVGGVMTGVAPQFPNGSAMARDMTEDAGKLGAQIDAMMSEPGAMMGFSYLSDAGIEGYRYNWSISPLTDGTKELSILNHVGENPFFFAAGRAAYHPEHYSNSRDWIVRMDYYMEEYFRPLMGEDFAAYTLMREQMRPYLERVDSATGDKLVPSLADGQTAFVFDLANAKKSWGPFMPPASEPLPIPEIAVICGLSDKAMFLEAMAEYEELVRDILREMAVMIGDEFPEELDIPQREMVQIEGGDAYYYPFDELEAMELDEAFRPNLAVSDEFAIFSLTIQHSERLLAESSLPTDGPFSRQDQPLVAAAGLNWVALVDAVESWYQYAYEQGALEEMDFEEGEIPFTTDDLMTSLDTYFEISRCFRGVQSVTYIENGATVTNFRVQFQDIPW